MSSLPSLDTISNGTTADASEVDGNFTVIKDYINGELIERDGTTAMTGELTLSSSTPSGDLVAASKGYVTAYMARVGCTVTRSTNQTLAASSSTDVTYTAETEDTHGFWSSGSTVTIPSGRDGLYAISFVFDTDTFTLSNVRLRINGADALVQPVGGEAGLATIVRPLVAGDTVLARLVNGGTAGNITSATLYVNRVGF